MNQDQSNEFAQLIGGMLNVCTWLYWTPWTRLSHSPRHSFRRESNLWSRQAQHGADWMTQLAYRQRVYKKLWVWGACCPLCPHLCPGYPWNPSVFWGTDMRRKLPKRTPMICHRAKTWHRQRENPNRRPLGESVILFPEHSLLTLMAAHSLSYCKQRLLSRALPCFKSKSSSWVTEGVILQESETGV